ncbi:Mitochondrial import inner membrane translocase subunit TIM44 [Pseudolycoriella hygida]|uniref:Mitochondrial import inner membrane translocase subunit TIM44 n=1 Tax=Pseudolycoriella hygida TaxID=35572 RepID=A0A9Q0MXL4_9DIPT|nr:Mitochondrial import inner membrane translocase subunit TIM44 [Pseudolycoriella hygida]
MFFQLLLYWGNGSNVKTISNRSATHTDRCNVFNGLINTVVTKKMSKEKNTTVKQRKKPVDEGKNDTKTVKAKKKDEGRHVTFDNLPKKSAYRLWTRTVIVTSLLVIVYFVSSKQNERKFATQKEKIPYRSQNFPCSESYSQEISQYPSCAPMRCGRVIIDTLVTSEEVEVLRGLAESGFSFGGSSGGASIFDLHSGALSLGTQFVNVYKFAGAQEVFESNGAIKTYRDVKSKISHAISERFGISVGALYLTHPTFFSRITNATARTIHDEYWHPHVDKETYRSFHYTSLLYLSDFGKDFNGGRFVFEDGQEHNKTLYTVEPRKGRVSIFTSGAENLHYVEKVTDGKSSTTFSFVIISDRGNFIIILLSQDMVTCTEISAMQKWFVLRCYSGRRPGFFSSFLDNLKQEVEKNKEMKDSIKKFREEAQKLEQSDALKSARHKFNTVESEASKGGELLKERIGHLKDKVQDVLEEASKTDLAKKASQLGDEISKSAKGMSETISEQSQKISSSSTYQTISAASAEVKKEINSTGIHGRVYQSPIRLRKRVEIIDTQRPFEANTDATGIELHKDSKFFAQWEDFKNNNTYVNKVLDWKMKYDESENPVIRASRLLTDKVSDIMGNMFTKTELSETLTEICKIDPNFDQKDFLKYCETDIIPNILEAMVRGDLDILKDWCFESTYNIIATPIQQAKKIGYYLDSKILDIENVDLQIMCVRDQTRKVVEGDPDKVMRVNYVWVLCRDPGELNPKSAWRLMEISANSTEQFV